MYDLDKAEKVHLEGALVGYVFQLNDETWLPLSLLGNVLGPPSYKKDAQATIVRQVRGEGGVTPR